MPEGMGNERHRNLPPSPPPPPPPPPFRAWYRQQSQKDRNAFEGGIGLIVGVVVFSVLVQADRTGPFAHPAAVVLHLMATVLTLMVLLPWRRWGTLGCHVALVARGRARTLGAYTDTFHVIGAALALGSVLFVVRGVLHPVWIGYAVAMVLFAILVNVVVATVCGR